MGAPLVELLRVDPERLQRLLIEQELAGHPWLSRCGPRVIREVAAGLVQRLPEALDARLDAVLVEAFRRQPPEWESPERTPAGGMAGELAVSLPAQRLQSRHHPALQVQAGGRPVHEVVFDLSLEFVLQGVVLRLREGRPRAVAIDRVQGSGILMFGRHLLARFSEVPLSVPPLLPLESASTPLPLPPTDASPPHP